MARRRPVDLSTLCLTLDGDRWRVRTWPGPFVAVEGGETSSPCAGMTDELTRTITIALGTGGPDLADTLTHELLHAIFPDGIVDEATEERIVAGLEHRLRTAITHNDLGRLLAHLETLPAPDDGTRIEPAVGP